MILCNVKITKQDTCLSYCLKRTGLNHLSHVTDMEQAEAYFDMETFVPDAKGLEDLRVGDILVWTDNERWAVCPDEITADGIILSHRRLILRHTGVYEGNQLVSDCTISSKDYAFCHTIRMQRLTDASVQPTYIMRVKKPVIERVDLTEQVIAVIEDALPVIESASVPVVGGFASHRPQIPEVANETIREYFH